jgi:hypothetical protein
MLETYVDQFKMDKSEEVADFLKVQFNNMDGDLLSIEPIRFTRREVMDGLIIVAQRPSDYVRKSSCERIYTEDFTIQATDWFKMPIIELMWID